MTQELELTSVMWSQEQNCFHVESLIRTVGINMEQILEGRKTEDMNQYRIIAVLGNRKSANEFIDKLKEDYPDIFKRKQEANDYVYELLEMR